jgi:tetratricopeptide (TPR) repeat protein
MLRIALALFTTFQSVQPVPLDEISDAMAHAEALYYGARFSEAIALLSRVDETLQTQPARLQEKVNTKLRLALAYIGMNDTVKAKSFLIQLYALNPDYALDADQFSPKVISLAAEAKAEQTKMRCQTAEQEVRSALDAGNTKAFLDLFRSVRPKCAGLAAMEPEAAESLYKAGVAAYRRDAFADALLNFEAAVMLSPNHELAFQYIDVIRSKQQLTQDRMLLEWQRNFDGRQLSAAAADYRAIVSSSNGRSTPAITKINGEYRKALSSLVESWNRACASGDAAAMSTIRGQISELLPEPSFGEDIRGQMTTCPEVKKAVPTTEVQTESGQRPKTADDAVPAAAVSSECLDMQPQLALARLKTRVDPVIPSDIRHYLKNTAQLAVRVKARISENGDVTVTGMPEGNPILNNVVRSAVTQWKFAPVRDSNGPRCVDTEIPILIKLAQ